MALSILLALQFLSVTASTELVPYISVCTISHTLWGVLLFPVDLCHQRHWLTAHAINNLINQLTAWISYWSCVPFASLVSGEFIRRQPNSGNRAAPLGRIRNQLIHCSLITSNH